MKETEEGVTVGVHAKNEQPKIVFPLSSHAEAELGADSGNAQPKVRKYEGEIENYFHAMEEIMAHDRLQSREIMDFAEIMGLARGEVGLWRAVICQAFIDAISKPRNRFQQHDKEQALAWFRGRSADFYQVCESAGFEPDYVRERFARVLARRETFDHTLSGRRRVQPAAVSALRKKGKPYGFSRLAWRLTGFRYA